jgi:hypothetical protein
MKCGRGPSFIRMRRGFELPAVLRVEGMIGVLVTDVGARFCRGERKGG